MDGTAGTVLARVTPRRKWGEAQVEAALAELQDVGLIIRYSPEIPGNSGNNFLPQQLLLVTNWEKYQRLDRRAQTPEFPMPTETPGVSGNFRETPAEVKGSEVKGKEVKGKDNEAGRAAVTPQRSPRLPKPLPDSEWIESLKASEAYAHINVVIEIAKARVWLQTKHPRRAFTRAFILAWLNRIDPPIGGSNGQGPAAGVDYSEGVDEKGRFL